MFARYTMLYNEEYYTKGDHDQTTVVITKFKGFSGILRDIRTSTNQTGRIEENSKSNNHI